MANLKKLVVPENIKLVSAGSKVPLLFNQKKPTSFDEITFYDWLEMFVLPESAFGTGFKADMLRMKISEHFQDLPPGSEVELQDEWVEKLVRAVKSPTLKFNEFVVNNMIPRQCLPFQRAIMSLTGSEE